MTDFGDIGYATIEPGNGTQEEQISFSGVTQNANGTATLTGVKNVLFISPYTETSGTAKTHAGSTTLVISNTSGFYNQFPAKANDETITGQWTFDVFPITPATPDASTTVKGMSKLSVAAASATGPIVVGTNDPRVLVGYAVDNVGTDSYAITPTPAITSYVAGQVFTFKAGATNTGAATLAVSGLSPVNIKKNATDDLVTGDILIGAIVMVEYDGTNMQVISNVNNSNVQTFTTAGLNTWTKPANVSPNSLVKVKLWGGGGGGVASGFGGGGGGGGYSEWEVFASSLAATASVSVGAGGAPGSPGGDTTFAGLTAWGGGGAGATADGSGGVNAIGGGGGAGGTGESEAGVGGGFGGGTTASSDRDSAFGGGGGGCPGNAGGSSVYGGGGGGPASILDAYPGGNSIYGGGGGAGATASIAATAGTSVYGGNGGTGTIPGHQPGGGGGGRATGGDGEAIIITYY